MINGVNRKRLLLDHVACVHFTDKKAIFDDVTRSVFRTLSNIEDRTFCAFSR